MEYLVGIHTFKGRSEDELTVEKGDYIEVLEDDSAFNDSWYFGRNLSSFQTGLFPKAFTTNVISLPSDVQKRVATHDAQHPQKHLADLSQNSIPQPVVAPSTPIQNPPTTQPAYNGSASPAAHAAAQAATRASNNRNSSGRRPSDHTRVPSGSSAPQASDDIFGDISSGSPGGIVPSVPDLDNLNINGSSRSPVPSSTAPLASPSVSALNVDKSQSSNINGSVDREGSSSRPTQNFLNSYNGVPIADAESPNISSVAPLGTSHGNSSGVGAASVGGTSVGGSSVNSSATPSAPSIVSQPPASTATLSTAPVVAPSPQTVLSWTPTQVEAYFAGKGLTDEAPKFAQQKITGAILLEMDRETLKEIDILGFGPRFEIEREIKMLRGYAGISPSTESPASPTSPAVSYGSSMGSLMTTPVMQQPGYFSYGVPQQGASTVTLSAYPNSNMNPYGNRTFSAGSGMVSPVIPQGQPGMAARSPPQAFQFQSPQPQPQNVMQPAYMAQSSPYLAQQPPPSQYQQYRQQSQANLAQQQQQQQQQPQQHSKTQSRGQQIPPIPQSQQQKQRLAQQQPDQPSTSSQPINIAKHRKGSSSISSQGNEEVTGSLSSNFSVPPSQGVTSTQAAGRGGGHHRQASSVSRYSVGPQSNHRRSRTLDDWESSGLLPASSETNLRNPSPSHHQRNISRGSNVSGRSNRNISSGYDDSVKYLSHSRSGSTDSSKQNRRLSIFSRLSGSPKKKPSLGTFEVLPTNHIKSTPAPPNLATPNGSVKSPSIGSPSTVTATDSPQTSNGSNGNSQKRISSDNSAFSKLRPTLQKTKTSAFQEGIKNVTAEQAASSALKSGWMHKRGGNGIGVWSKRYFTLHDTRLSYFASFNDTKEKGLIDITGYRVVPVKDHELLVSLTAAGMGAGRHCFKLVPPGPGYKKGVAFTAPKVHYFAVDSAEEMREWQSALMSATIERDDTAPVLSTCQLPTISLPKAQELMAERLKTKGDIGSLTK